MDIGYLQLSTLVLAIFVGVCLFILSRYIRIPTIVLLLVGGVILGPEFLRVINPDSLGEGLRLIISLSVAIILFEGGLTLHPEGLKKAPKIIWRLLTLGVLITWFGTAILINLLLDFSVSMSLLAGSLIIVTGPTVIAPLLKRILIKKKLYHILHWEGVLIDPIGVFIAILCFEWFSIEGNFLTHIWQLGYRLLIGSIIGFIGGKIITLLLKKEIIPEDQGNIFVFASALFLFGISDFIMHEAGILTVVIAGLVIGWANPPRLKHIQQFKSELTELAIALVFILLAANLELKQFIEMGWKVIIVLGGVLFIIRPLSIIFCSYRTSLSFNEKLFLSWIAPRGVIAGSMASLFGIKLMALGHPEAIFLETFTFSVIVSTIVLQGGTASMISKWLKVKEPDKKGWLIVGANAFSRKIADFITKTTKSDCIFLDTNADTIIEMKENGFNAFQGNALSLEALPSEIKAVTGNVLAMTDNRDLNQLICEKWSEIVDKRNLFRWSSQSPEVERQIAGMGVPIWTHLMKPSQISYDFQNGEILLQLQNNKEFNYKNNNSIILMSENRGKIFFDTQVKPSEMTQILLLERHSRSLTRLLLHKHIFFIESGSYKDALHEVFNQVHRLYPELPHEQISSALIEREMDFPTTLVHGVAAPHVHFPTLTEPLCFIAQIPDGIKLHTYEGELVQLLFVLLSPKSEPELHLQLLAEIAKIVSVREVVQRLIKAQTAEELIQHIIENKT
jgi:NhaP-type Na+/H+ or K+/H+ antiporter/mannitol/fructose-specific phosphotransferase system IIA component (Ntr-type)